jgi:hypothetical protein
MESQDIQVPRVQDFKTIIDEHNAFKPSFLHSMQHNCEQLAIHLKSLLCLSTIAPIQQREEATFDNDRYLFDYEILEYATAHELPIFVSIDGSLEDNSATVSVSIVAPDIKTLDIDMEWQSRPAKVLLIRAWKLPNRWGTSSTCINMTEVLGFIIGESTIPPNLPIIYITDSNNARVLQRNIFHKNNLTHRTMTRKAKQGIEYSLANHLEHLTSLWMGLEYLDNQDKECYLRGKNSCHLKSYTRHNSNGQ